MNHKPLITPQIVSIALIVVIVVLSSIAESITLAAQTILIVLIAMTGVFYMTITQARNGDGSVTDAVKRGALICLLLVPAIAGGSWLYIIALEALQAAYTG